MKKITWIIALLAALALIFVGCPGAGDEEDDNNNGGGGDDTNIDLTTVFSATPTTQDKAIVTVSGSTATFAYNNNAEIWGELVTAEEARWDASAYSGIKFEYKTPANITVFAQDTDSIFIFGFNDSDGWGAVPSADNWTEITLPFSILQRQDWFGTAGHTFNKSAIIKFAFQIGSGAESGYKIEIRNFIAY